MSHSAIRPRLLALVTVPAALVAAVTLGVPSASAATTTDIKSAKVIDRTTVDVTVSYSCDPGRSINRIRATVQQGANYSSGRAPTACDGTLQHAVVRATRVLTLGGGFQAGQEARVTAELLYSNGLVVGGASSAKYVTLR